jgi:2-polyprenyl-3-methyl-5-hydroxy-6-metoxy-1,4-benzoquinol methylase
MVMTDSRQKTGRLRLLVVIASYGQKNLPFLKQIIRIYQNMTMEVDLIVVSESPKELGSGVKVVVGLPSANPWSLPFAHKAIFAENVERYDLLVYTEDDIEVAEGQIQAFLRATAAMGPDEIPGYLRYETGQDGTKLLTDVHGSFCWKPESARHRGEYTIAEFTNEHAGFYILTQAQLRQAIASGGFLKKPYEGRYGLPETAATDPYTCCGFRKVICISVLDDFLIRHMSNLYVNRHGVPLSRFKEQVQTLIDISNGTHPVSALCEVKSKMLHLDWSKHYYEAPSEAFLKMVPEDAKQILSIGCGWGAAENKLKQRGAEVTALPLDSVIGAAAARLGIEVIYGTLEECLTNLEGRRFDCVLVSNLLHLQPNPIQVLQRCSLFVREGGTLVVSNPNFGRIPVMLRRALGIGDYKKLRSFSLGGINPYGMNFMKRQLKRLGFRTVAVQWFDRMPSQNLVAVRRCLGRFMAGDWILKAQRRPVSRN